MSAGAPLRFGINGFGRIGRCVFWALHHRGLSDRLQLVQINDPGELDTLRLLARYDSTHGRFNVPVTPTDDGFEVDGLRTRFSKAESVSDIRWDDLDLVMECSGRDPDRARAQAHLAQGARRVQVGAPAGADMPLTLIRGINHDQLTDQTHYSLGSCTTNCLGVVFQALTGIGIDAGTYTTIHSYTNDQVLVDVAHRDPRRARAAAHSMVPTSTNALNALEWVMPTIAGKVVGYSMRVPTLNVSCVDMTLQLDQPMSRADIQSRFVAAAEGALNGLLATTDEPLVSIDFCGHPASAIVDLGLLQVTGSLVRIVAWYDNEWGYANRMLDTALQLHELNAKEFS